MDHEQLVQSVETQGAKVKKLKAEGADAALIAQEVEELKRLKASLAEAEAKLMTKKFDRASLEELLKKRFFYAPAFNIYGGVSGLYDYGPPGCAVQANMLDVWRRHFVLEEDMLEVDCTMLTPHDVLKTSGHVDRFADLMCKDTKTGDIFRVDHLVEGELERRIEDDHEARLGKKVKGRELVKLDDATRDEYNSILAQIDGYNADQLSALIKKHNILSPVGNPVSEPEVFNLMFGTSIGPTGNLKGYLRPETAQGQFLNFKKLLEFNNDRMPFASAQIGRSFRNEISPRSGLLRVREFTMAEIEHYVNPEKKDHVRFKEVYDVQLNLLPASTQMQGKADISLVAIGKAVDDGTVNNQTLGYFMARIHLFLLKIGVRPEKLRFRQHLKNEMAHYACDCWDAEIQTSYGWIECVGCADRSAYDLTRHTERTKEKLVAREPLKEPVIVQKLELTINKRILGPRMKKDAKVVENFLTGLSQSELKKVDSEMKANGGKMTVKVDSNLTVELDQELISIAEVTEKMHVLEYTPNVIEPSFGIGRLMYSLFEHNWWIRDGDENRHVLSFPPCIAPFKCLILPLSNNAEFAPILQSLSKQFRELGISHKVDDSTASIGKRYARNDELGTPFGVTVDFQSIQDGTVTLRERDTTKQIREKVEVIVRVVRELVEEKTTWNDVIKTYRIFAQQEV